MVQVQMVHDGNLSAVLADLEEIKTCSKIDASLYTAEMTDRNECKASVMRCFLLEMEVILYESRYGSDTKFTNTVRNVLKNVHTHFANQLLQLKETSTCQKCETFEEKKCTEFLKRFKVLMQQFYIELAGKKQNS